MTRPLTIDQFARQVRTGQVSSVEVTNECLRCIETHDSQLNAFILVMADEARQQALQADRELASGADRGPLHGVPISIKDLFDISGTPTTAASHVREGHVARQDAVAITHLRTAGVVLIGKTNLHEFAFGTTNEESAFGPSLNPHDPTRSPGGSSGGSAVSLAAGMALATLGTDTGGSIRIPASACGTVGLKPTFGELSTEGVVPLSRTLDHVGPLTATVTDAWHVYHALHGGNRRPRPLAPHATNDLRLAILRPYFCDLLDEDVRTGFESALAELRAAGVTVGEVAIRRANLIPATYLQIVLGDAAAYHSTSLDTVPERYTPSVRLRLEMARYVLAEDYVRATEAQDWFRREVDVALRGNDALVLPTLPIPAPILGARTVRIGASDEPVRNVMLRLTQLFNLTGHPAISLPCGKTPAGLPYGLQLVGTRMQTENLLSVAKTIETILSNLFI